MDWTIDQLQAFVAAAETGSFSAAGRLLGKAQSVISTHVSALEDSTGIELFDRTSRYPLLTQAGKDLLPEARAVLRQSSRFDSIALAKCRGDALRINISLGFGIPFQHVSDTVMAMLQHYHYLTGEFKLDSIENIVGDVRESRMHLGLILGENPPVSDSFGTVCLGHRQYCAIADKNYPLVKRNSIREEDLTQYRQILPESASRYFMSAEYLVVNSLAWAVHLAALGAGWTVVPVDVAHRVLQSYKNLVIIAEKRVKNMPVFNIYAIWNKDFERQDVLQFFIDDMQKRFAEDENGLA